MIAIIDYGMGNLRSVQKGFEKMGHVADVTRDAQKIEAAAGVVLPGVGAFGACMNGLAECGLVETVHRVVEHSTPFLGICVGMQILFSESIEFGRVKGLDILKGTVRRFDLATLHGNKIPHMGWNQLHMDHHPLEHLEQRPLEHQGQRPPHLDGIEEGASVYFVHSYYPVPDDAAIVATTTEYGTTFASSVWSGNVFATQFHPEKSQAIGLRILANFGNLVKDHMSGSLSLDLNP